MARCDATRRGLSLPGRVGQVFTEGPVVLAAGLLLDIPITPIGRRRGRRNVSAQLVRQLGLIAHELPPRGVERTVKLSRDVWSWLATQAQRLG